MTNQPEPSLRDFIAGSFKQFLETDPRGSTSASCEIAADYIDHRIQADKEAAVREARLDQMDYVDQRLIGKNPGGERVFYDKEVCIAESKLKDHQRIISEAMKAELRLTHPQAGEPDHLTQVSLCPVCKTMTHTHDGVCTRCGELKVGEGEGK